MFNQYYQFKISIIIFSFHHRFSMDNYFVIVWQNAARGSKLLFKTFCSITQIESQNYFFIKTINQSTQENTNNNYYTEVLDYFWSLTIFLINATTQGSKQVVIVVNCDFHKKILKPQKISPQYSSGSSEKTGQFFQCLSITSAMRCTSKDHARRFQICLNSNGRSMKHSKTQFVGFQTGGSSRSISMDPLAMIWRRVLLFK